MPDPVIPEEEVDPIVDPNTPPKEPETPPKPDAATQAIIDAAVQEALKPIKSKLNDAYKARDEAKEEATQAAKKLRDAEIEKMKAEGKVLEAAEAEKADLAARLSAAEERNLRLTRDNDVKDALSDYEFRTPRARDMAKKDIIGELVQDQEGVWKHKSGVSIEEFVGTFMKLEDNAFLLKPKQSTGLGGQRPKTDPPVKKSESLFGRTQAEVLADVAEGRITRRKR